MTALALCASAAQADGFEVPSFAAEGFNADTTPSIDAGARPSELRNSFSFNTVLAPADDPHPQELPAANVKDVIVDLPPGIVGNAAAFPKCSQEQFSRYELRCPMNSQIGYVDVTYLIGGGPFTGRAAVYNMEPPRGMPAQFAFEIIISKVHINFHVRSGSDYGVTAVVPNINVSGPVYGQAITIWGVPGDPSHDEFRVTGGFTPGVDEGHPYPEPPPFKPFLSNPTSCIGPVSTTMAATSWQRPDEAVSGPVAEADGMTGCDQLEFDPSVEAKPTTNVADSPSGLDFHLEIPQSQDPDARASAHLRKSKVALPAGLTVNPSSANGLGACTLSQIGYVGSSAERQLLRYELPPTGFSESFAVSSGGQSTPPIAAKASRLEVAQAIEGLPGLAGNITLSGAPGGWIVAFTGALAGTDAPELTGIVTDNPTQTLEVTGEGGGYYLGFGAASAGSMFEASFGAGEEYLSISKQSRDLKVGDAISGPGIPPGATVIGFNFGIQSLPQISALTTSAQAAAHLVSELPFDAPAAEIQEALRSIPAFRPVERFPGNVFVSGLGTDGDTRSYRVVFAGELSGSEPDLTATTSLTGPGAGVGFTKVPPAVAHSLDVKTLSDAVATGTPQFTPAPADCPDASKLGTVRIDSPDVVDHPLEGSVYLATPHENPFGSLLAIYIAVNDPETGVVVKLPGLIEADPKTGQLTATVSEAPQLPFEDLQLEFFKGAAAPLKTGIACGTPDPDNPNDPFTTYTDMVPWSAPEGATMHPSDSFAIDKGAGGGACVSSEAQAPNTPRFEAGTADPVAGAYSPFSLKLTRADGTQQLRGIDTTLPKGLIAKLAGVPYCSDAALASAASKLGKAELASPSCPSAAKVGTVTVGAGAGPQPFYTSGAAYLAGPYKGAPLSLAVITPAVAGPFDLGTVVVRNALYVNPESAVVHAVSDPFPSILQGIPLDLRSVVLNLDKPKFTKNPTNCAPFAITGALSALTGQSTPLNQRFQVGDCAKLAFKPKLSLSLKGATKRGGHPALKAVLSAKEGESNIARTVVALPHSEFLAQSHIKTICTRVQFAADQCPAGSIYGKATASTPLLDQPLSGPVYLRSSSNPLPDLVAALHGQIDVDLVGRIDSVKGGIRTTFDSVPDAPVSKFVLQMQGGKKGLLENSRNLCKSVNRANVQMDGQSGKPFDTTPVLKSSCKKAKGKKHRAKK